MAITILDQNDKTELEGKIENKLNKSNISQEPGEAEDKVMSQKATTEGLNEMRDLFTESDEIAYSHGSFENGVFWVSTDLSVFNGFSIPILKSTLPEKVSAITIIPTTNVSEVTIAVDLYDQNQKLLKNLPAVS